MVASSEKFNQDKYLVLSWFPGAGIGKTFSMHNDNYEELITKYIESMGSHNIAAVLWCQDADKPEEYELCAVLLVDEAQKLFDSAAHFSENGIEEWFSALAGECDDKHYIRILPRYDKSIDRFIQNAGMCGSSIDRSKVVVYFGFVQFISQGPNSNFAKIFPKLGDEIKILLIDSSLIDENTDPQEIPGIIENNSIEFGTLQLSKQNMSLEQLNGGPQE